MSIKKANIYICYIIAKNTIKIYVYSNLNEMLPLKECSEITGFLPICKTKIPYFIYDENGSLMISVRRVLAKHDFLIKVIHLHITFLMTWRQS